MTDALAIKALSAGYGRRPVVAGITLPSLAEGTVTVLAGPNGAGKSTLLRAVAGFLPAAGSVTLGGRDLLAAGPAARAGIVGFMPQALPGDIGLTVLDSVMTALKVSQPDCPVAKARERAAGILGRLGILPLALARLGRLSGGQKQIASLAQALVADPKLLLLDEPVSALDLRHQFRVMRTIRSLAGEGRIVIVVLHDLEMASRWADRIVVMREGGLFAAGTPREVVTPGMLRQVYGVEARVSAGDGLRIAIEDVVEEPFKEKAP
ncbi:ABC transporter ATP-binding protein [Shinella sp. BYT-45]|uniref:ABC transporter ATP-binding protein n=1 Tax=Shinella sp. BYT-45 TaxID=3377377 RepID=UPI00397FCDB3